MGIERISVSKVLKMKSIIVFSLIFVVNCICLAQSKEEKLQMLKSRTDIKVTEIEKDILRLEYPSGNVLYKNIGDYKFPESGIAYPVSPTFDSTIIDLTTIDTTLYYQKYKFWQEVPLKNLDFDYLRIGDVNNNGRTELYGMRKFFWSNYEPVTVYELNETSRYDSIYQYDSIYIIRNTYDIDNDSEVEVQLLGSLYDERFFSKDSDSSLATTLNFSFNPDLPYQLDDPTLGEFDGNQQTDLVFDKASNVYIFEYNPFINNFDSVFHFQVPDPIDLGVGGYSVGDFDLDGKTDIVFSTMRGKVFVIENEGDNQYTDVWQGSVESNNAYIHTWTNDIDKNGKTEFLVLADAYYNGIGTTRMTIFETDGDNSYQAVGRIDLVGVFSFYAGNMQAIDLDGDGTEEIVICIDNNLLILKFNGTEDHHTYEVYYIKQNELGTEEEYQVYVGAIMYDLQNTGEYEILISMYHTVEEQPNFYNTRYVTKIYKADSTTNVNDEILIPEQIKLYQNYPNPFNPTTKIKFDIPQTETERPFQGGAGLPASGGGGLVTLKVYDILGNEVATLVNETKPSGTYEVEFSAIGLTSGVYFYQLQAGDFLSTKKLVLLK